MAALAEIEGIGATFAAKLKDNGVDTVEELLKEGGSPSGRASIARKTGIDESKILEWVNRADLMRIKGVGSEFSDLLEAAGVDSVKELAQRRADNLHAKMSEMNEKKNLVNRVPGLAEVEGWIKQAGDMKGAVSH